MTFGEFFVLVKGFNKREEMRWRRTFRLWAVQVKDPCSFDEFIGRQPALTQEAKFRQLWDAVERDRASGKKEITG